MLPTDAILPETAATAIPLELVLEAEHAAWLALQPERVRAMLGAQRFEGRRHSHALVYAENGGLDRVVVGLRSHEDVWGLGLLGALLPAGDYILPEALAPALRERLGLGFVLGAYQFARYRSKAAAAGARLLLGVGVDRGQVAALAAAVWAARDMVNTPTEDLGPAQLAAIVRELAEQHTAGFREVVGAELLAERFPAIHAVGRASHRPPRLIELLWGDPAHPRVAILGKGVCFDTGGLNIKAGEGMALMKKDMGGAAVAIQLAALVMRARLPLRLQLLVPAVENAIGPDSYRPGEVLATRAGITVEIGNTDAEGRVVLCDALSLAVESNPALILDFATLTGAARIALGPDLPALFSNREDLATALQQSGREAGDPLWPMPLWEDYYPLIDSRIADLNNAGNSRMAGAITAALYLKRFVPDSVPWAHLDTYCWSDGKPGRPAGGDAQGLRAAFAYLQRRFAAD